MIGGGLVYQGGDDVVVAERPIFWVNNTAVTSIWEPLDTAPYLVRHLQEPIRIVMGFWCHSYVPISDRAEMAGLLPGEYIAINRMLYESEVGAVLFCRRFELPGSASVDLKRPFRCKGCGGLIRRLPCIQCWNGPDDDPHV